MYMVSNEVTSLERVKFRGGSPTATANASDGEIKAAAKRIQFVASELSTCASVFFVTAQAT